MREKSLVVSNYVGYLLGTALMVAFQCAMWFQFLGTFPSPQLWIPSMVFWFLYRDPLEGMIMMYLLCGLLSTQTSLPFSSFLIICSALFIIVLLIKQRFYWSGGSFYTVLCGAFCFSFFLFEYIGSHLFEPNPIAMPSLWSWFVSPILTMIFALPLYFLFHSFDRFSHKEQPREATGGVE